MSELPIISSELGVPFRFLTSLAIGLLLGLQRERTPSAKAGLRTFALVALFGTVSALIADSTASAWILAAGLLLVGLMIIAAYRHPDGIPEEDSGTTTVIALLLCYGLGVMVWHDWSQLAVAIAIVATALLHFKSELHGFTERLSRGEVASILQFAVLSFVILPLLPNEGYGPYRVLNPYHIWLMVVLVSGVSLAGYLALRMLGAGRSLPLVGVFGGMVSSTATTLVYARQGRVHPAMAAGGAVIIAIANLVVLARLAVICSVVAPGTVPTLLPVLAGGVVFGAVPLALRLRSVLHQRDVEMPPLSNPTQLRVALGFGAIYAVVLVGSAWLSGRAGDGGLYAMAVVSGFVDIDAITLSSLSLYNGGKAAAPVVATAIGIAYAANVVLKLGVLAVVGGRGMFTNCLPALLAPVAGIAAALLLLV
jgi:uncharacterized membrane protein (DUF4010 family)